MKYFSIFDKNLRQYFNCNRTLEIFLTCFCNILCAMRVHYRIALSGCLGRIL